MANENRNSYLLKNTVIFAIGNIATKIINFALVPLYTHMLSTQEYGTIDLISTIGMLLVPVLLLNISESVIRFSLDKNVDYNQIMSIGLVVLVFATFIGSIMLPIGKLINGIGEYSVYIFLYTISIASSQVFLGYLRGKEKLLFYTCGNIINTFSVAVFNILFLVILKLGIKGYLLAYIIANFITCIYAFIIGRIIDVIKNFSFNRTLMTSMLKYSLVLLPNAFMWWIMNSADRIVITAVIGGAANGIFAIAYKIPSLMSTVAGVFNQAWSFSAIREDESADKVKYTNKIYSGFFMVISLSALGMIAILKPFMKFYVNETYFVAWKYAPYLIIGYVFQSLASFLATPYTVYKDSKGFLYSAIFGACINIILNYLLVFRLGLTGVAIATCLSYVGVFIYRLNDTKKYMRVDVFNKRYIIIMILIMVQAGILYFDSIIAQAGMIFIFMWGLFMQYKTLRIIIVNIKRKIVRK